MRSASKSKFRRQRHVDSLEFVKPCFVPPLPVKFELLPPSTADLHTASTRPLHTRSEKRLKVFKHVRVTKRSVQTKQGQRPGGLKFVNLTPDQLLPVGASSEFRNRFHRQLSRSRWFPVKQVYKVPSSQPTTAETPPECSRRTERPMTKQVSAPRLIRRSRPRPKKESARLEAWDTSITSDS